MGWTALSFSFRGCGDSSGQFSLEGWANDVASAVAWMTASGEVHNVWVAGFGTGGALGLSAAAHDDAVAGVAALGAPADFADWASHPKRLLEHARSAGVITGTDYPPSIDRWARQAARAAGRGVCGRARRSTPAPGPRQRGRACSPAGCPGDRRRSRGGRSAGHRRSRARSAPRSPVDRRAVGLVGPPRDRRAGPAGIVGRRCRRRLTERRGSVPYAGGR